MKFADINRQFTEIAESYLDHGYHINTATMGPSSGEVAHLDLTNGSVLKGKHHGERFYGTRDEAEAAAKTRSDRAVAIYMSACPSVMTSRAAKIAERYISRVTGIKHPNRAKLNVRHAIRRDDERVYGQYIVTYNGKSYILH